MLHTMKRMRSRAPATCRASPLVSVSSIASNTSNSTRFPSIETTCTDVAMTLADMTTMQDNEAWQLGLPDAPGPSRCKQRRMYLTTNHLCREPFPLAIANDIVTLVEDSNDYYKLSFLAKLWRDGRFATHSIEQLVRMTYVNPCKPVQIMVPYVSRIQWNMSNPKDRPSWLSTETEVRATRETLALYVGTLKNSTSNSTRRLLVQHCVAMQEHCEVVTDDKSIALDDATHVHLLQHTDAIEYYMMRKRESMYCLETPVLSAGRLSMIDSMLSGCVPVFVMERTLWETMWPLHMPWRADATLWLDPQVLQDQSFDLHKWLRKQPYAALHRALVHSVDSIAYSMGEADVYDAIHITHRALNALVGAPNTTVEERSVDRGPTVWDRPR